MNPAQIAVRAFLDAFEHAIESNQEINGCDAVDKVGQLLPLFQRAEKDW